MTKDYSKKSENENLNNFYTNSLRRIRKYGAQAVLGYTLIVGGLAIPISHIFPKYELLANKESATSFGLAIAGGFLVGNSLRKRKNLARDLENRLNSNGENAQ